MSMTTVTKRQSAMNPACPWRMSLPIPDGTIAAGDRAHTAFMYSGFLDDGEVSTIFEYEVILVSDISPTTISGHANAAVTLLTDITATRLTGGGNSTTIAALANLATALVADGTTIKLVGADNSSTIAGFTNPAQTLVGD